MQTIGLEADVVEEIDETVLVPTENFSMYVKTTKNNGKRCYGCISQRVPKEEELFIPQETRLAINSVLYLHLFLTRVTSTLILEEYPDQNMRFLDQEGIKLVQFGVPGNKPFVDIPEDIMRQALAFMLDKRNHPILIHCNKGKHRTGCLVGLIRKYCRWSYTSIFDEYRRFSFPKSRAMDQQFIELFDMELLEVDPAHIPKWPEIDTF